MSSRYSGGLPRLASHFERMPGIDTQRLEEERKMRQMTVILVTAVVTATVTVFSMMAISSNPVRLAADVDANSPIDVMKMMRDAKNLPIQSYPAH